MLGGGAMAHVIRYFREQPFVLLFLVVAAGYAMGKVKFKGVTLGATASTILIGLALSLLASARYGVEFQISDFASSLFFNLFMFSVGMKVGPQFFGGLKKDARHFVLLGVFTPLLAAGLALACQYLFKMPAGMAAGLLGGSNTASPGLGAAKDALEGAASRLPAGTSVEHAVGSLSTAFAFTYCLSMALFIVMMKLLPKLSHTDVVHDAEVFEKEANAGGPALPGTAEAFFTGTLPVDVRVYRVEHADFVGLPLRELRREFPYASLERVRRRGALVELGDDDVVELGDEVAIGARIDDLIKAPPRVGPEIADNSLRDIPTETADVVVHDERVAGSMLLELAKEVEHGLYLNAMFRAGVAIPHGPNVVVAKGDVLRVTGSREHVERFGAIAGAIVRPSLATDIVTLAIGLAVGAVLGALSLTVHGVKLSLGSAVGLLLTGIVLSTLRTRNPAFGGPFPEPARELLEDFGLNVFIAILGLNAGSSVVRAFHEGAIVPILVGAVVVGFVPPLIAWFVGLRRFHMNSALLMGAVAGARCNSAGMQASQEATASNVPAVSYPVTFALSNVILTLLCYLFAALLV